MQSIWQPLTDITLCIVYLGFNGLWGSMLAHARRHHDWRLAAGFGVLVILPAGLALPWTLAVRALAWCAGLLLVWLFMSRPSLLPEWLWQSRFTFAYVTLSMALIFSWCVASGHPSLWLWMGIPASCLSLLGLRRVIS